MKFLLKRQHEAVILIFHFGIRTWNFMFWRILEKKLSIQLFFKPITITTSHSKKSCLNTIHSFSQTITVITTLNVSQVHTLIPSVFMTTTRNRAILQLCNLVGNSSGYCRAPLTWVHLSVSTLDLMQELLLHFGSPVKGTTELSVVSRTVSMGSIHEIYYGELHCT